MSQIGGAFRRISTEEMENQYEENPDAGNPQSVRERQTRRLRRMPDFLPIGLQDQLRRRQSEVREPV